MKIAKKAKSENKPVTSTTKLDEAIENIHAAIDCLGAVSLEDRSNVVARESIANLSVVLFDLQK